jgi:hypothetical protein
MSMTITTPAVTTTDRNTRSTTSLRRTTVGVGLVAAAVTTGAAATVHATVPSIGLPPDVATKIALVTTHILAAAIIVPVLARHADD